MAIHSKVEIGRLERVVRALNDDAPDGRLLRSVVDLWIDARWDWERLVVAAGSRQPHSLNALDSAAAFAALYSVPRWAPDVKAAKRLKRRARRHVRQRTDWRRRLDELWISRHREKVQRCRRKNCPRPYFVNRRGDPRKRFCSSQCARHETVVAFVKRKRAAEAQKKARRVNGAIRAAKRLKRPPLDLKGWIARRAGVTKWWIAYHNKKGELEQTSWSR